ncbi:endo-1,4-beta-xylanase 5-like isoform X2 [Cornus florida]|uniref:endo-1,4-beta-xylanase 5-like isoform X2 n=1 Tax=Cornus florida TaxID=4283 RepID=UPI00289C8484|nr:endo-1,4-beta-xylanase 5-like isoform X2 [Cornus florida]
MPDPQFFCLLVLVLLIGSSMASPYGSPMASPYEGPLYDSTAYTECKEHPEKPLYDGGILKDYVPDFTPNIGNNGTGIPLQHLTQGTIYCFSTWVKINGADSALVGASLMTENTTLECIGNVVARRGCWSFLKGGFILDSSSNISFLKFQNSDDTDIGIEIAGASLQQFTEQQWGMNQQYIINTERKRAVTIHVSDELGDRLKGAVVRVEQVSKDFPFGSAIAGTIIGNKPYQNWFVERFNAAVFENELKWYTTEPKQGQINYTLADQMLEFLRANKIIARGHNIFWEDPQLIPAWVVKLTRSELQSAVDSRIESLMSKYREEFIHWDVSNENLHFDFFEQKLGPNASLHFFETARQSDPLATLFLNEFNVVETCSDNKTSVDGYISWIRELERAGVSMDGIGLEGHFGVPNRPLMRAVLDKLATLRLPIWLTEIDISKIVPKQEVRAVYLEEVLRESFSHPSVNGIMLWTAIHPNGCYRMCLTDNEFRNLPAGDVVDKLLKEWQTGVLEGHTDEHGAYSFSGFLGEYKVTVDYGNRTANSTFSLCRADETRHFNIQL